MIVNRKKIPLLEEREAARLESTMQNIADYFVDLSENVLQTFLTYNLRRKTISTTKREYVPEGSLLETPEGCFYDLMYNAYDLLAHFCQIQVPLLLSPEEYIRKGPSFIFLYHPALGPLYSIIGQKIRGGSLSLHSEMQLDIAEIDCEELAVQGSLIVRAKNLLGDKSTEGQVRYNRQTGKCTLKRVRILNAGIDPYASHCYWKNEIHRRELCEIVLLGNGEFIAEDVVLRGNMRIEVRNGFRVRALEEAGQLLFIEEKIEAPTWHWRYRIAANSIQLELEKAADL
jgi:hypothetical protein